MMPGRSIAYFAQDHPRTQYTGHLGGAAAAGGVQSRRVRTPHADPLLSVVLAVVHADPHCPASIAIWHQAAMRYVGGYKKGGGEGFRNGIAAAVSEPTCEDYDALHHALITDLVVICTVSCHDALQDHTVRELDGPSLARCHHPEGQARTQVKARKFACCSTAMRAALSCQCLGAAQGRCVALPDPRLQFSGTCSVALAHSFLVILSLLKRQHMVLRVLVQAANEPTQMSSVQHARRQTDSDCNDADIMLHKTI